MLFLISIELLEVSFSFLPRYHLLIGLKPSQHVGSSTTPQYFKLRRLLR